MNGANLVASAIIGNDFKTIIVNNKAYVIKAPTIHIIAGAMCHLSDVGEGETIQDIVKTLANLESATKALSWFIQGDDALSEELSKGSFDELVNGIDTAISFISAENFIKLSVLVKNVQKLIAKPKL